MAESHPPRVHKTLSNTIFQGAVDVLFDGGYLNAVELKRAFYDAGICLNSRDMKDLMIPATIGETFLYNKKRVVIHVL